MYKKMLKKCYVHGLSNGGLENQEQFHKANNLDATLTADGQKSTHVFQI